MEKRKYIMIGTNLITRELFRTVLRPTDNITFRPSGGFWSSPYLEYQISSWFMCLKNNPELLYYKDITKAVLFSLKDDARILTIRDEATLNKILGKYPSYQHLSNYCAGEEQSINYEALSNDYDGIFLDQKELYHFYFTNIFRAWNVDTLLLFNLDAIDSYQRIDIDFEYPDMLLLPHLKKGEEIKIEEETIFHIEISNYSQAIFNELLKTKSSFTDYDDYFSFLMDCLKKCIERTMTNQKNKASIIKEKLKEKGIETTEYIIIRSICLNTLSNYFKNNVSIENSLPKTKKRTLKEYTFEENEK